MPQPFALIFVLLVGCSSDVKTEDTSADSTGTIETTRSDTTSPYANCEVVFSTTQSTKVSDLIYDSNGRLLQINTDLDGDGSIDDTTDYTWTTNESGTLVHSESQSTLGASSQVDYDAQGWPVYIDTDDGSSTKTSNLVNTYSNGLIVQTDQTSDTGLPTVTLYDLCENTAEITINNSVPYTFQWIYASGCTPSQSQLFFNTEVITTTYDAAGRHTRTSGDASPDTWTWTWTCP